MNERTLRAGDSEGTKESADGLNSFPNSTVYPVNNPQYETYLKGWLTGYHSRDAEIANLNARCDNLYLAAFSPKVRAQMIERRLDEHFAAEEARLYAEWTR